MTDITDAINKAREAAGAIVEAEVVSTTLPSTATTPALTLGTGKRSMASAGVSGGVSNKVDGWLKIGKTGFSIDKDLGVFDDAEFIVGMHNRNERRIGAHCRAHRRGRNYAAPIGRHERDIAARFQRGQYRWMFNRR